MGAVRNSGTTGFTKKTEHVQFCKLLGYRQAKFERRCPRPGGWSLAETFCD